MYHVLIADDHAVVRSGLAYLINQQPNFEVIDEAADGTSTYLRVEQGDVDILVRTCLESFQEYSQEG